RSTAWRNCLRSTRACLAMIGVVALRLGLRFGHVLAVLGGAVPLGARAVIGLAFAGAAVGVGAAARVGGAAASSPQSLTPLCPRHAPRLDLPDHEVPSLHIALTAPAAAGVAAGAALATGGAASAFFE